MRFLAPWARAALCALAVLFLVSLLAGPAWADDVVATLQGVPLLGPYLPYIVVAGALCAAISTILPAPGPGAPLAWVIVYLAVNWIGLNIGHARNADDAAAARRASQQAAVVLLPLALVLSACGEQSTAKLDTFLTAADQKIVHFCRVQQPIIGRLARVTAAGVALADPNAAAAVPLTGLVVGLIDGTCAGVGGEDVAKPVEGTPVVVPPAPGV